MTDQISAWLDSGGYLAIALLMFAENVFPPIPSEIVMPLAGYAASRGDLSLWGVTLAGSIGSLAGALFWYAIGAWFGLTRLRGFAAKHGRWLTLSPKEVDAADRWFDRYGGWAVLIGRLVPGVRTFISVPAGISDMPMGRFLLFTTIGTVAWTALLAAAGFWLGEEFDRVSVWMDPVTKVILAVIVVSYVWRLVRWKRETD